MDGGPMANTGLVLGMKFFVNAPDEPALRGNKLELRVPQLARVWIKAGSADIEASGVTGGLDLNIVGGSVRVSGSPRELIVESMDGGVTVNGSPEFARLKTATGDIVLQGGGEDVTLTTVSGAIRASDGLVQRGRFESVTGPITFAADLARGADARFDTHSGAIELRLARRANVEIDASSITGSIENAWTNGRPIVGREGRGMELGISSGTGSARVSIRSFKGNVRLAIK
jgi:Putative adhesin